MLLRFLSFLKIVDDEFSGIVNDAELYADRIRKGTSISVQKIM
ncbi:MAG: hypothetical protein ACLFVX_04055 [Archaeoglobaceae archaeon]